MPETLILKRIRESSIPLANGVELVANIITEIAGNDISSSINKDSITLQKIRCLAASRFERKFGEQNNASK